MNFPPPATTDPTSTLLAPLKDDSSAYAIVARTCLSLTQFAGYGSSATTEEASTVATVALFHEASYATNVSTTLTALIECLQAHKDRRCRMLAAKTLAILARSAYARTRPSPLVYALKESNVHRLEDEVGTEVPVALVTAALDDSDNGVSAAALEAMGLVTLTSSSTVGTLLEDEFLREIQAIALAKPTPYAPSLRQMVDEDVSIPQMELTTRIYENIMAPRLLQLLDRIAWYRSQPLLALVIPVVTACLVHHVQTTPSIAFAMDRATYAKRWVDVNSIGLVDHFVSTLLLPALESSTQGTLLHAAALAVVRLAHVVPHAGWAGPACLAAARALKEQLHQQPCDMETKLGTLAALVVTLRNVPFPERTKLLVLVASVVAAAVPSTTMVPCNSSGGGGGGGGIVCAGIVLEWQGYRCFRRPARIGLWTELALSIFVDGAVIVPGGSGTTTTTNLTSMPGNNMMNSRNPATVRNDALVAFLHSPALKKILDEKIRGPVAMLSLFDELLLVFATVAVDTGRRLRVTPDGTLLVADPEAPEVAEWIQLAWTVLTTFSSCVDMQPKPPASSNFQTTSHSMEEEWTILAAGQASYVRLVQEYMYMVGLLNPDTSVALKLTPNALPPQMLWDQMSESAAFLSKFFEAVDLNKHETTSVLMDEIVAREIKTGIASHHMRMFLLSLAADNWVQGRVLSARKHFESLATGGGASGGATLLSLRSQDACDIVLALSPRRLIAKLLEGNAKSDGEDNKKKKDPLKKLALETVRVSVACIESIALTACEWRRRFGSSQELKQIVSITVGMLQGKVDETPIDDTMQAVIAPVCDAAVTRIQAFYEKEGGGDTAFPASELVTQPVKPKIKPLISPSKPAKSASEKVLSGHIMQLCRQIIRSRIEQCVASFPPADSLLTCARPSNWLRLSLPPLPESKDARLLGNYFDPLSLWGTSVASSSATSDAAALVTAYTPRRYVRYDGEDEFRLTVIMRATNITAVEFLEGLRLELHVMTKTLDPAEKEDPVSQEIVEALGLTLETEEVKKDRSSAMVAFRHELKAGESLTWEVSLDPMLLEANSVLLPSVVFRNIKVENVEIGAKWAGDKASMSGDASAATGSTGGNTKSGEDDFQVTDRGNNAAADESNIHTEHACLMGEPLFLSPMVGLQPCPLVFFRNNIGDVGTFRFLWFNVPHHIPGLKVVSSTKGQAPPASPTDVKLAEMSALQWGGEAIPGGYATKTWAFADLKGQRLLCVLAETDTGSAALHFRGDRSLLYAIGVTKRARESVVAALLPGMMLME